MNLVIAVAVSSIWVSSFAAILPNLSLIKPSVRFATNAHQTRASADLIALFDFEPKMQVGIGTDMNLNYGSFQDYRVAPKRKTAELHDHYADFRRSEPRIDDFAWVHLLLSSLDDPICDGCESVQSQFYECGRYIPNPYEPCDYEQCIINTIDSAACEYNPAGDPGNNKCEANPIPNTIGVSQELVLNFYWKPDCQEVEYHHWITTYQGCDTCSFSSWFVRCDVSGCYGISLGSSIRAVKNECDC